VRRLAFPAALAHRTWRRVGWPNADRALGDVDVVHGTNYVVPPSARPRLVSVYDCWFLRHPEQANGDVRRAGAVLRRSLDTGAVVHACSEATGSAVAEIFPGAPVHVVRLAPIPLAPPPRHPPVAELAGARYVLALGTIERRKNLPRLVAAFALAAPRVPDLRLVIAGGDGDDRLAVDRAIDAAGASVAQRILLTGWVDDSARSWLLHHASALAYTSLDEGFGFPLLDAMQAGVPIVASNVGSIREVAGDAALLSDATDVDAIAQHLVDAVTDDPTRERLIGAGARQLRAFSWDDTARQMSDLYRRLHGRGAL
jgi:glycosyltransferase involved in cell wall biosynthesis